MAGTRMPPLSAISGTSSSPVTKIDSPDPTIGNGNSHTPPLVSPAPHTTTWYVRGVSHGATEQQQSAKPHS